MSMFSPFRISLSPKPTTRSRTRITASGVATTGAALGTIGAATARSRIARSSIAALIVQAGEEHREQTVGDDHHENRFHNRKRNLPAKRFCRTLYGKSFDRGDQAD